MKKFWKSKTLWLNAIALIGVIVTGFGVDSETVAAWLGAEGIAIALINAILRAVTNTGLER